MAQCDLTLANIRPWGASLRPVTIGRSTEKLEDPAGRFWDSVRDCLWGAHLDMCMCEDQDDQLELLRATLRCIAEDMHRIDPDAMVEHLFDGSLMFFRHYLLTLGHHQFVEHEAVVFKHAQLSPLGWSVLAMLEATKPVIIENRADPAADRAAAIQRGENRIHID
ncbi:hypothetical protein [Stakelama marina]|uniref:Uncharacterized protein n=1 Tax=Stakelama marina TaxID=2826939 RepID=A0A8T4IN51_9SPHN|nr:hypothetical protein [Stakelama marina]MBR0553759.1 hypothetical protein [Stakelama marina]